MCVTYFNNKSVLLQGVFGRGDLVFMLKIDEQISFLFFSRFLKVIKMRKAISFLMLFLLATPVFAKINEVPEPEVFSLVAIGAIGMMLSRRKK